MCPTCAKLDLPDGAVAPTEKRDDYCDCIKWTTLDQCIKLACKNAERLVGDAELLFKAGRLESALVFITFAEEEVGKAVMASQWWFQRKNITRDQYYETFRDRESHLQKLIEASKLHSVQSMPEILRVHIAKDQLSRRERALYTDYDFGLREWTLPRLDFVSRFDPEAAREGEKIFDRFDSLIISDEIRKIRKGTASLLDVFEKNRDKHIPNAAISIPDPEPGIIIPPRRFTLAWLKEMEDALEDKRVELKNALADTRYAKFPSVAYNPSLESLRKGIAEQESPEAKRVLAKMLVDELRHDVFGKYLVAADAAGDDQEYLKAMELMNEWVTMFAIPFCRRRRYPAILKRLVNGLNDKRDRPPFDAVQQWKDSYNECLRVMKTTTASLDGLRKYHRLQRDLTMLNFQSE